MGHNNPNREEGELIQLHHDPNQLDTTHEEEDGAVGTEEVTTGMNISND